jgi:hypothetical protein
MILTVAIGTFLGNITLLILLTALSAWAEYKKEQSARERSIKLQEAMMAEQERMIKYAKMES